MPSYGAIGKEDIFDDTEEEEAEDLTEQSRKVEDSTKKSLKGEEKEKDTGSQERY